jgi:hypothetical protein
MTIAGSPGLYPAKSRLHTITTEGNDPT